MSRLKGELLRAGPTLDSLRLALPPSVAKALRHGGRSDAQELLADLDTLNLCRHPSAAVALRIYLGAARSLSVSPDVVHACDMALVELGDGPRALEDTESTGLVHALVGLWHDTPVTTSRQEPRPTYLLCGRRDEWELLDGRLSTSGRDRFLVTGPDTEDHPRFLERLRLWGDQIGAAQPAIRVEGSGGLWMYEAASAYAEELWYELSGQAAGAPAGPALRDAVRQLLARRIAKVLPARSGLLRVLLIHPVFLRRPTNAALEKQLCEYHEWLVETLAWPEPANGLDQQIVAIQPIAWREPAASQKGPVSPWGSDPEELKLKPLRSADVERFLMSVHRLRQPDAEREARAITRGAHSSEEIYDNLQGRYPQTERAA